MAEHVQDLAGRVRCGGSVEGQLRIVLRGEACPLGHEQGARSQAFAMLVPGPAGFSIQPTHAVAEPVQQLVIGVVGTGRCAGRRPVAHQFGVQVSHTDR
jgi:hypothetical protein